MLLSQLHSGPVTAGVLRGQKSRFQLFGDTVNTASRMETTGLRNRIHASEATVQELRKYHKGYWVCTRKDTVYVKGKGEMTTYWVKPSETGTRRVEGSVTTTSQTKVDGIVDRTQGLIKWNTDVLAKLLRAIVARRESRKYVDSTDVWRSKVPEKYQTGSVIDEVKEIIELPEFLHNNPCADPDAIQLDPSILSQLHDFVDAIARKYCSHSNPFHNFDQ